MEVGMNGDYIKLYRKMLKWEWYTDNNVKALYVHCLLKANFQDGRFQGKEIPKGSFVTSLNHLAKETGLTQKQVRVALNKLKMTNEVASKGTNKYTIITINKWEDYQGLPKDEGKENGEDEGKQRANKGQQ